MYRKDKGELVFSPSDLIRFMESPFASWMERLRLERPEAVQRDEASEELKLVAKTGDAHEADFLKSLNEEGKAVREIPGDRDAAFEATRKAIADGCEIIYQGYLKLPPFAGYTDFLVRADDQGSRGPFYEVWDTKLARKTKPYYLIQLCCYAEMLVPLQAGRPEHVRVVLGTREIKGYRTEDFFFYYLDLKEAFLAQMETFAPDGEPPVPDARADHGLWQSHADKWLIDRDHLVQVAGISVGQIGKLNEAGIQTVVELAKAGRKRVPKLGGDALKRLVDQAGMQIETRRKEERAGAKEIVPPAFRVIEASGIDQRSGLALLPPPSKGDVFFDIEGFPLKEQGLEYLLGAVTLKRGKPEFHDWWAHNPAEEKRAFEQFVDWAYRRWRADPDMHIYHYASYEVSAVRRLMGCYGTREEEVDQLLRNEVFVDLYRVVRQGILFGDVGYSLKNVEKLYKERREGDVASAGASMVYYAWWIESGQPPDWRKSKILREIRHYNEEDCVSTWKLAGWLRSQQRKHGIGYCPPTAEQEGDDAEAKDRPPGNPEVERRRNLAAKLLAQIPEDGEERGKAPERWRIQELLSYLLEFHRREAKPVWWAMFDRHAMTEEELIEDADCLGGLRRVDEEPESIARSLGYWYTFDPEQDTKLSEGKRARLAHDLGVKVTVHRFDPDGRVQLKIGKKQLDDRLGGEMPERLSLIPEEFVSAKPIEEAIARLAEEWDRKGRLPEAFRRFLLRQPPRIAGDRSRSGLLKKGEDPVKGCIRLARSMRGSTLCVQGPPGAGKTYAASHMIVSLLKDGKNIGITSHSHQAILNVMKTCHETADGTLQAIKAGGDNDPVLEQCSGITHIKESQAAIDRYGGGLIGGTAWLFSRSDMEGRLDYLFVDEAGQVSVANLAGMCRATENLVLIGDQMQLAQPIQGAHPGESGQSLLQYLLRDNAVVPNHLGGFLDHTWRMHPEVCEFISGSVYEGRLRAHGSTVNRIVRTAAKSKNHVPTQAGIVFSPIEHQGNTQGSEEEVDRIVEITRQLLGRKHTDEAGNVVGPLRIEDILYVAPYNMQVRRLRERLPAGARVGSVDRFQGQEAPVVILSVCSSAGDFGARGIGFVLNRNRLNVAISRARSLVVVVGDPNIAHTPVGSVGDMERVNLFCRVVRKHRASFVSDTEGQPSATTRGSRRARVSAP